MKIGYTEAIHYTQKGKQIEVVNNLYRTLFFDLGCDYFELAPSFVK